VTTELHIIDPTGFIFVEHLEHSTAVMTIVAPQMLASLTTDPRFKVFEAGFIVVGLEQGVHSASMSTGGGFYGR